MSYEDIIDNQSQECPIKSQADNFKQDCENGFYPFFRSQESPANKKDKLDKLADISIFDKQHDRGRQSNFIFRDYSAYCKYNMYAKMSI